MPLPQAIILGLSVGIWVTMPPVMIFTLLCSFVLAGLALAIYGAYQVSPEQNEQEIIAHHGLVTFAVMYLGTAFMLSILFGNNTPEQGLLLAAFILYGSHLLLLV
jgi:hypothetical protein